MAALGPPSQRPEEARHGSGGRAASDGRRACASAAALPVLSHPPHYRLLVELSDWPGAFGRTVKRKLRRRARRKSQRDFASVCAALGPGDIALDLGANQGLYTRMLAETGAEVHAFEPNPHLAAALAESFRDRPNVRVHAAAIGMRDGVATLHFVDGYTPGGARGSESSSLLFQHDRMAQGHSAEVRVVGLPRFMARLGRPVVLIKMDIEGSDWDLLDFLMGAAAPSFHYLFAELHERFDPEIYRRRAIDLKRRALRATFPHIDLFWS